MVWWEWTEEKCQRLHCNIITDKQVLIAYQKASNQIIHSQHAKHK